MDRRIEAILATIEKDPSPTWTTNTLAKSVGLSVSRLRHLFKHEVGKTLTQYIKEERIRRAEHLLRSSFLTIKQIADETGHLSGNYFSREFKKLFGLSPTTYRRRFGTQTKRQKEQSPK